jgi:hypothetical protein
MNKREEQSMCIGCWWKSRIERAQGRLRHKCLNNIKMDLKEIGCGDMDWIGLAQDSNK